MRKGQYLFRPMRIRSLQADITTLEVDAVVNAANESLLGGGGVDGAIHRAAGPGLLEECRRTGGCPTGESRITAGHDLPARWVIHTVGPVWRGGDRHEADLLASCYRSSLAAADAVGATSIAYPAISTGVYGFPREEAAAVAVSTLRATPTDVADAVLVAFDRATLGIYERLLAD
jgi:O-acetyl-ADP-ribose deacetylase (regulator of RNase III)